jgi:uncharacterized protein YjbI with pentapeptide repeats
VEEGHNRRRAHSAGLVFGWSVLVGVCSILAYVAIGRGDLLDARAEQPAAADAKRAQPNPQRLARYNVTLSAKSARLVRGQDGVTRLVLKRVNPLVEMADVSPGTERQAIATWIWVKEWRTLYRRFQPNTTIVWTEGGTRRALTVALASGSFDGRTMSFAVRRLALGTRRALPITSRVIPQRSKALGAVDVFVDPYSPPQQQSIVQTALQTYGLYKAGPQTWTVTTSPSVPDALAPSTLYKALANGTTSGTVTLQLQQGVGFASGDLPGTRLSIQPSGVNYPGYFRNLNLVGGALVIGNASTSVSGLVFYDLRLGGGELVLPTVGENPTSNIFANADLTNATVSVVSAPGTIFVNPTINGTQFEGAGSGLGSGLQGVTFLGADFSNGFLMDGVNFAGATLGPWQEQQRSGATTNVLTSFAGLNLPANVSFGGGGDGGIALGALLSSVDFTGTTLNGTTFTNATISGGSFANAVLNGDVGFASTTIDGTSFANAQITGATTFADASISGSSFSGARITGTASFAGASISGASFNGAQIASGTTFQGSNVSGTTFAQATLANAMFQGATLTQADFSLATFTGDAGQVSFANAQIGAGTVFTSGSGIENADFTGATLDGVVFATGGAANGGSPPTFIASLLNSIAGTSDKGVIITNQATGEASQFFKIDGTLYLAPAGGGQGPWQQITIAPDGTITTVPGGGGAGGGGDAGGGGNGGGNGGGGDVVPDPGGGGDAEAVQFG